MSTDYIQGVTGNTGMAQYLEKQFDVYDNKDLALADALKFNRTNENRNKFIALIEQTEDGTRIVIKPKTLDTIQ